MLFRWKGANAFEPDKHEHKGKISGKVLVLNQNYEPMSVCNVQKAVILLYLGKAELIAKYDGRVLRSVTTSIPVPSIVRIGMYIKIPYKKIVLSRKNILRRDNHKCQYCGSTESPLTIDHVVPKARGGEETWENLITACIRCNNRKGDRTPEEAHLTARSTPRRPSHLLFLKHVAGHVDEQWKPYLYM